MSVTEILKEIEKLDWRERDKIYRELWARYVTDDVLAIKGDLKKEEADKIARDYVLNGDYDCNMPYWDNLEALIEIHLRQEQTA